MLLRGTATAIAAPHSAALRKLSPARAVVAPRTNTTHRRTALMRVATVVNASSSAGDNAAQAQAWVDAWRAKSAKGGAAASHVAAAQPTAAQAQAWIEAWRAKQSSGGGASLQSWAHFAVSMAAFLAADRALITFAASNGARLGSSKAVSHRAAADSRAAPTLRNQLPAAAAGHVCAHSRAVGD